MAGYGKINHASVKELIHLKGLSSNHTPDHAHVTIFPYATSSSTKTK